MLRVHGQDWHWISPSRPSQPLSLAFSTLALPRSQYAVVFAIQTGGLPGGAQAERSLDIKSADYSKLK